MHSPKRTAAARTSAAAALGITFAVLCSTCVLDLDGLTTPGQGGAGGTSGTGGTGGAAGGTGGGGGADCPLLDCCPEGEAIQLVQGPVFADLPRGIVVRDDGVYWVNIQGGNVLRMPAAGGEPEPIALAASPRGLALSGDTLAWTASDGVYVCTLPSCSDAQMIAPSLAAESLRWLAFDGATMVFTDRGEGEGDGRTRSCSVDGCRPIDLADNMIAPEGVTLEGGLAFWVDQGNGNDNGLVGRSPKDSASVKQVAAALDLPSGVAADETYVYWTEQTASGHVYRCAFAEGYCDAPEDIAPAAGPLARPGDIQIGGGRIYWMNADDGSIMSCPQPGCGAQMPEVHATGRTGLSRLAVGSFCLFWTENGRGGAVMKTAR